jgi:hypothetical protein
MSGLIHSLPTVSLPWQGLKAGNKKQKYEKISERKIAFNTPNIREGWFNTPNISFNDKPCMHFSV